MNATASRCTPWPARILLVLFCAVAVPIGATLIYHYPPTRYAYLPCPFHWMTGLHCPACGSTRCAHALLHGDIRQALAYNVLLVISLPLLAYVGSRTGFELWTGREAPGISFPVWLQRSLLVLVALYWIARNIGVYPFTLLAPHEL